MFGLFRRVNEKAPPPAREPAPVQVVIDGASFDLSAHMRATPEGFPTLDWQAVWEWIQTLDGDRRGQGWVAAARGWMLHMRDCLGERYELYEGSATILSALDGDDARAADEFIARTLKRVGGVLRGIADAQNANRVLIVFDDEETYYRYASQFYPERGEFSLSSGMHVNRGFSHFITTKADMRAIEPVIAHELTHSCVSHLRLPLWVNEGLAVNTEVRLTGSKPGRFSPREMHARHMKFWTADTIQQYWSGNAFYRPDEGSELAYALAQLLVEQLAADWARFAAFATAANFEDAGAAAAREHFGIDLGQAVAAVLEKQYDAGWSPDPDRWEKLETRTD